MSIKFSCPHCHKELNVKDHAAGKRAPCPACKKILTVPAPISRPADIEELAAAAFSEQPPAPAPDRPTATIAFTCFFCDTKVQVSAELAGKQTSCPECRRIVKVPALQKQDPKDWRKVDTRLPAGARRDTEPAPEGTWGTGSVGTVSHQALLEAAALPQVRKRWTSRQWTKLGAAVAACVGVIGIASWIIIHRLGQSRQTEALAKALQSVDAEGKVGFETVAEVRRAAGEYYLRADRADLANAQFQMARAAIRTNEKADANEQDLMLIDLARSQVELGGDKTDVQNGARLKWDEAQNEVRQTLQLLHSAEGRIEAVRQVGRILISKGQGARVAPLASLAPKETPGLLALVGLEMLQANPDDAKTRKLVEQLAQQAQDRLPKRAAQKGDKKPAGPPPPASLIALWLALGKLDKAKELAPPPAKDTHIVDPAILVGYVEGFARHGDLKIASAAAREAGSAKDRLPALVAVAAVALDNNQADAARSDLQEALKSVNDPGARAVSPWLRLRLVRLSLQAGLEADRVKAMADTIDDKALRGRAHFEVLRSKLAATKNQSDDSILSALGKDTLSYGLAMEALARHNTRTGDGSAVLKAVDGWEPEKLRPFGYVGVALGQQDSSR